MYQRYYDGYDIYDESNECNESNEIIPAEYSVLQSDDAAISSQAPEIALFGGGENILGPLAIDDILLIGVLLFLLHEECDDKLMIIIIGFVLLAGFIN